MENNRMMITDDSGVQHEAEILLTFDDEENHISYVLFTDPENPEAGVFAYSYDEDGNMNEVTDPQAREMCEEVLAAFQEEQDTDE